MKAIRYLPRFADADRALATLAGNENWTRQQIAAFQLDSINRIWRHAIGTVPYYEKLYRGLCLPDRFDDLQHFHDSVPVLTKQTVRNDPMLFLSRSKCPGFWCRTGGSTGSPMEVYWDAGAYLEVLRTKYRAFQMWDVDYLDRIAFLWGHSTWFQPGIRGKLARWRQPIEDYLRNRLRLSAYHIGPEHLAQYLKRLHHFSPVSLYGYPSAIRLLAEQARRESFSLKSLRQIVVTGEPIDKVNVDNIEGTFNVPVVIEYGSVDCGHIAHEWRDRTIRVREDIVHVETVEQDPSRHEIIVTQFRNLAFPLIRYGIEDVSSRALEIPESGFAILHDVIGRNNDFLQTKENDVLHSSRLDALFKYQCQGIRRFHVHQRAEGNVDVFVELNQQIKDPEKQIEKLLFDLVGFPICVQVVDQIKLTQAGKHRLLISDRPNFHLRQPKSL